MTSSRVKVPGPIIKETGGKSKPSRPKRDSKPPRSRVARRPPPRRYPSLWIQAVTYWVTAGTIFLISSPVVLTHRW